MKVTVVTSIYGGVDPLRAHPEQTVPCDWVAVVDQEMPTSGPWRQVVEPRPHMQPRLAAKYAKLFPHVYAPDADVTIWIDGGAMLVSSDFVAACLDALADGHRAQWVHPERDCIYPEADVTIRMEKYGAQPVREQVTWYRLTGHPEHWGLWATGCIVRRGIDPVDDLWLNEMMRWTVQDQLSLPYVLRRSGSALPKPMPGNLWHNPWVSWMGHKR